MIAALKGLCGACGHAWLQHPNAGRQDSYGLVKSLAMQVLADDPCPAIAQHCSVDCPCPAHRVFLPDGAIGIIVPVDAPCCGEKLAIFSLDPKEHAGAPWTTGCGHCGAGLVVSRVVDVAVIQ